MDCIVHRVAKSRTRLSDFHFHFKDYSPPGSSVHGILQAGIIERVVISFPGDFPDPGIEPGSPALQADS